MAPCHSHCFPGKYFHYNDIFADDAIGVDGEVENNYNYKCGLFFSGKEGVKLVSDIDSMVSGPRYIYIVISTQHYRVHQPSYHHRQFKVS